MLNDGTRSEKEEALAIDPDTAEVCWDYGEYSDPYKIYPVVPEFPVDPLEKMYFVRRPDGDIWVWDNDLPDAVFAALWERLEAIEDDIPCFMSVRAYHESDQVFSALLHYPADSPPL